MWPLVTLCLLFNPTNAQFAEIASIATSLLGSGLGPALGGAASAGSAASPALGALSQIGQLYQLAQGALQLTGTGVGVLNQASEGNWFPAVLEQASKNTKTLMGGAGGLGGPPNLGALGPGRTGVSGSAIGPEFGTGFPAPSIEDYTDNEDKSNKKTTKSPESLVDIDDNDFDELTSSTSHTASPTPTVPVTLFPDESNSVTEATTVQLKEIRIELPKGTDTDTDVDYIDRVTTDGDSRVQVTNKAKSTEDENLLAPDRASAAKTLNAKIRSGVPDLTRLIDVLRKSNLKEAEIMEIVSQVEGNDNNPPPPKIDFTSAVQNIPLKKHLNRERIVKASREINKNIGPHEKELESHINHFHQLPNPAASGTHSGVTPTTAPPSLTHFSQIPTHPNQQGFLGTNRLEREISAVPTGKAPLQVSPPPNPALLLPQAQFTPPPAYLFQHHWHNPQFPQPQLPAAPHSPQLYQPQANLAQPPAHAFAHPPFFHHLPYQPFHMQQQYTNQIQNPTVPAHIQSAPPPTQAPILQQQLQQVQNPQQFQPHLQLQQHQQGQLNPPYQGQQPHNSQQSQQNYHYSTQQQVTTSQQQPYRQFRQISGQAYQSQGVQTRPVVYTNQPAGTPAEYNRITHVALSAPIRRGDTVIAQGARSAHVAARAVHPGSAPANSGKTRGVGYSSRQRTERDSKAPPSANSVRSAEIVRSESTQGEQCQLRGSPLQHRSVWLTTLTSCSTNHSLTSSLCSSR
ncbi:unnamed protein product [Cylicocyclus nassatus]|uniref:Uncharacterized protein n=1 Tax=Cylicocyclus nassatus TaxID=53992 RepID=A0AA36HGR7_CYLNA|nr:unnamed protein product [Cylicocyclus nassatus]